MPVDEFLFTLGLTGANSIDEFEDMLAELAESMLAPLGCGALATTVTEGIRTAVEPERGRRPVDVQFRIAASSIEITVIAGGREVWRVVHPRG